VGTSKKSSKVVIESLSISVLPSEQAMSAAPTTRPSLLCRIRQRSDQASWSEFVGLYGPIIYGHARRQGLQDSDAADLMQDVFRSICSTAGRFDYDPSRGKFRSWLFTIVRNKLRDQRGRCRPIATGGSDANLRLNEIPAENDGEEAWNRDYQQRLFAHAASLVQGQVRDHSWRAFWRTAVDGASASAVAAELGLPIASVYLARSRITARLRMIVAELESLDSSTGETS
jgi:RNA polymerase sigma-70 factor (ECF subfamily)